MNTVMEVNGLTAILNTPKALIGEGVHGLPPHDPRPVYPVDEYKNSSDSWMHGSSKASSYFAPVEVGRGMWFDFTRNHNHTHDVAVVVSVQGVNPITGPIPGDKNNLRLEQYKNQCPRHKVDFQQDRYCPECKYKWPGQNYISTTTGQTLWIDGFRNEKGEVRQYVLTEDESLGVAAQLIGDERVYAIGFAFYLSKEPKPRPARITRSSYGMKTLSLEPEGTMMPTSASAPSRRKLTKRMEVGAGAKIQQDVGYDPKDLDYWKDEPEGLIYVNYVTPELAESIINGGKREDKPDGFLGGLKWVES